MEAIGKATSFGTIKYIYQATGWQSIPYALDRAILTPVFFGL